MEVDTGSPACSQTWRVTPARQVRLVGFGLFFTVVGLVFVTASGSLHGWATALVGVVIIVVAVVGTWLAAFRPRVVLCGKSVTVVNPFRTVRLPLDRVGLSPGGRLGAMAIMAFTGTEIQTVNAWAVQTSMYEAWRHPQTTREDEIRAIIQAAARRAAQ